jgi:hypothetical protein
LWLIGLELQKLNLIRRPEWRWVFRLLYRVQTRTMKVCCGDGQWDESEVKLEQEAA